MLPEDFTVGWICALPLELTAAQGMLDEKYEDSDLVQEPIDTNQYTLGQIAGHQIAVTCLISAGNNHASSAAIHMQYTFKNLRFILMVGIGGGIPNLSMGNDVRLGDVVVSRPSGTSSGVIQYDSGKLLQGQDFLRQGALRPPPQHLQKVVNSLIAKHESEENRVATHIDEMLQKHPGNTRTQTDYRRPGRGNDLLFRAEYVCNTEGRSCTDCDLEQLITRQDRPEDKPVIHYGNIASGNSVVRDALKRDHLGRDCAALCVEMEAAGMMDDSECLVIRGICDYADTHKNKDWQRYAAATAAAYAKELLGEVRLNPEAVQTRSTTGFGTGRRSTSSPRTLASHGAGSSRTSSTGSTGSSPPPKVFESRPRFPLPPLQPTQSVDKPPLRRNTIDQPSASQIPPRLAQPPASPPPSPLPLPQRFNTVEPVHFRSASNVSSPSPVEGAWECREGEHILMAFQGEMCSFRRVGSQVADNMGRCDFRIFELGKDDSLPTRRIAFRSCEPGERCMSFWMPLDNVYVGTKHGKVTVSWSDCSHIHEETKAYRTTFTCRYIPANYNRQLEFEFKDVSVFPKVAEVLLYPTLESSHYKQSSVVTGSSTIDTLRVFKHYTGGESAQKGADEWSDFAILVSSNPTNSTRSSKIYIGRPCLDFQLDKSLLTFKKMRCLDYSSDLIKFSEKDILRHLNPEGGPDRLGWKVEDLELSTTNHKGLTLANLMSSLTGWECLFSEDVSNVVVKGRARFSHKIKGALVMIWKREYESGSDIQLLVRASDVNGESKSMIWLSTSLTSPLVYLKKPEITVITMEVQACWRGPEVSIHKMTVDPSSAPECKPRSIQLHFKTADDANRFHSVSGTTDQLLRQTTSGEGKAGALWHEESSSVSKRSTSTEL